MSIFALAKVRVIERGLDRRRGGHEKKAIVLVDDNGIFDKSMSEIAAEANRGQNLVVKIVSEENVISAMKNGMSVRGAYLKYSYGKPYIDMVNDKADIFKKMKDASWPVQYIGLRWLEAYDSCCDFYIYLPMVVCRNQGSNDVTFMCGIEAVLTLSAANNQMVCVGSRAVVNDWNKHKQVGAINFGYTDTTYCKYVTNEIREYRQTENDQFVNMLLRYKQLLNASYTPDSLGRLDMREVCQPVALSDEPRQIVECRDCIEQTVECYINNVKNDRNADGLYVEAYNKGHGRLDEELVYLFLTHCDGSVVMPSYKKDLANLKKMVIMAKYSEPTISGFGLDMTFVGSFDETSNTWANYIAVIHDGYIIDLLYNPVLHINSDARYVIFPFVKYEINSAGANTVVSLNGIDYDIGNLSLEGLTTCFSGMVYPTIRTHIKGDATPLNDIDKCVFGVMNPSRPQYENIWLGIWNIKSLMALLKGERHEVLDSKTMASSGFFVSDWENTTRQVMDIVRTNRGVDFAIYNESSQYTKWNWLVNTEQLLYGQKGFAAAYGEIPNDSPILTFVKHIKFVKNDIEDSRDYILGIIIDFAALLKEGIGIWEPIKIAQDLGLMCY